MAHMARTFGSHAWLARLARMACMFGLHIGNPRYCSYLKSALSLSPPLRLNLIDGQVHYEHMKTELGLKIFGIQIQRIIKFTDRTIPPQIKMKMQSQFTSQSESRIQVLTVPQSFAPSSDQVVMNSNISKLIKKKFLLTVQILYRS